MQQRCYHPWFSFFLPFLESFLLDISPSGELEILFCLPGKFIGRLDLSQSTDSAQDKKQNAKILFVNLTIIVYHLFFDL